MSFNFKADRGKGKRAVEPTSRFSPKTPLKEEVPFGSTTNKENIEDLDLRVKIEESRNRMTPTQRIRPGKPTQRDRERIIKARLQKLAGIDDIVKKITDIGMKERRKNIIISPKAGFPSSQRFDPTTPLKTKVPFGENPRGSIGIRRLSLPRERSTLRRLDLERKDATETALDIMNEEKPGRFVNPKTKKIRPPKPTQRQRKEIIQAKLEKMAGRFDIKPTRIQQVTPFKIEKTKINKFTGKPQKFIQFTPEEAAFIEGDVNKIRPRKQDFPSDLKKRLAKLGDDVRRMKEAQQRLGIIVPLVRKKKKTRVIKKLTPKKAMQVHKADILGPLRGSDIIRRFKDSGVLKNISKNKGFTFLPDENIARDAFIPADAEALRTKFKTKPTQSLAFISRSKTTRSVDEPDFVSKLEGIRTEGKTPLIGGFNDPDRGFGFDASFAENVDNDDLVINELKKTNQRESLVIDPDLTVRNVQNPSFQKEFNKFDQ